jgi:hypothetical protein
MGQQPMPDRRNTDADAELRQAVRRYVIARESGVAASGHYHEMRHALRRAQGQHESKETA